MPAACSDKRNVTVWCPSVRPSGGRRIVNKSSASAELSYLVELH